jgi:hypothetical protein
MKNNKDHINIINDVHKEIKEKYNISLDRRVVDLVATHPFLFTSERIRDNNDNKAIRHRYLFIIAMYKNKKNNKLQSNNTTVNK